MKDIMTWKSYLLLSFAFASFGFAEETNQFNNYPSKAISAAKEGDHGTFSIKADLLVWKPLQDGLQYIVTNEKVESENLVGKEKLTTGRFKPGLRLGTHYLSTWEDFDYKFEWTYFYNKSRNTARTTSKVPLLENVWTMPSVLNSNPPLQNSLGGANANMSKASGKWKMALHFFDMNIGRNIRPVGVKQLLLRPHVGLRYTVIDQGLNISHKRGLDPTFPSFNERIKLSNDYRAWGIRSGFDTNWAFTTFDGISIYANGAATLAIGNQKTKYQSDAKEQQPLDTEEIAINLRNHSHTGKGIIDLGIGLRVVKMCDNNHAFTFQLGWEQHLVRNLNQVSRYVNGAGNAIKNHGDFMTAGVTFSGKYDF